MTESKVPVELDRPISMRDCGPDIASPMARLGEHILGLRVFTIERHSLKGGVACLTHERSEVIDRAEIPLHDQRAGKPKMGVREIGIERKRLFEQAIGCRAIGAGALVHMPEATLTIVPSAHVLRPLCDYALAFCAGERWLDRGDDTRGDVVLYCEDVNQISVVTLGPEVGASGYVDKLTADADPLSRPAHAPLEEVANAKIAANLL